MAKLRTKIMDFRGFDSIIILFLSGGVLMSIGDFQESLSRAILVGIMLVGRLGVAKVVKWFEPPRSEYESPSESIQFTTDSFATRREAVQVQRYEYEPPCPPPRPAE